MKKEFEKEQKDNQIDDMFLDMPDMDDDEKFSQWLEEEYQREADEIEEALFADQKYDENSEIVKKLSVSREDFYQRLREEGLLEEDASVQEEELSEKENLANSEEVSGKKASENDDTSGREENDGKKILEFRKDTKETSGKKKHSYVRLGRIAGIAGVCLICVFAASMSSEANRKYLVNSVRILSGNDSQLISYNDETNEDASTEESDAIADIEEKLGVKMPEFYYRPYGMEFDKYEVNELSCFAKIDYQYKNTIISFNVNKQSKSTASNSSSTNGKEKETVLTTSDGREVKLKEIDDSGDLEPTYTATWKYENAIYYLSGKLKRNEIEKIIKYMKI